MSNGDPGFWREARSEAVKTFNAKLRGIIVLIVMCAWVAAELLDRSTPALAETARLAFVAYVIDRVSARGNGAHG